jgi:hypothetical protein
MVSAELSLGVAKETPCDVTTGEMSQRDMVVILALFTPGNLRKTRAMRQVSERIESLMMHNVENLRWAPLQNLDRVLGLCCKPERVPRGNDHSHPRRLSSGWCKAVTTGGRRCKRNIKSENGECSSRVDQIRREKALDIVYFYCPQSVRDFQRNVSICPVWHLMIGSFWQSKDWAEKLIFAFGYPDQWKVLHTVWLLRQVEVPRVVRALADRAQAMDDVYRARQTIRVFTEIGGPKTISHLHNQVQYIVTMVRYEAIFVLGRHEEIAESGTQYLDSDEVCSRWRVDA